MLIHTRAIAINVCIIYTTGEICMTNLCKLKHITATLCKRNMRIIHTKDEVYMINICVYAKSTYDIIYYSKFF